MRRYPLDRLTLTTADSASHSDCSGNIPRARQHPYRAAERVLAAAGVPGNKADCPGRIGRGSALDGDTSAGQIACARKDAGVATTLGFRVAASNCQTCKSSRSKSKADAIRRTNSQIAFPPCAFRDDPATAASEPPVLRSEEPPRCDIEPPEPSVQQGQGVRRDEVDEFTHFGNTHKQKARL